MNLYLLRKINFFSEKHFIEQADGSRQNSIVSMRGDAKILLYDTNCKPDYIILQNAL